MIVRLPFQECRRRTWFANERSPFVHFWRSRTAFGLRATARASGFRRRQSIDGIAVIPPTIEAADPLLDAESELEHVQRAFCRAVAANPTTVGNAQGRFIKTSRRGVAHRPMRDIQRAWNMTLPVGLGGS